MKARLKEVISGFKQAKKRPSLKVVPGGKNKQKPETELLEKEVLACCQATD